MKDDSLQNKMATVSFSMNVDEIPNVISFLMEGVARKFSYLLLKEPDWKSDLKERNWNNALDCIADFENELNNAFIGLTDIKVLISQFKDIEKKEEQDGN